MSHDTDLMILLNFEKCLKDVKVMLNIWRKRNLSLLGKIQIVKTFAISKFVFCGSVLPVPMFVIKELEQVIKDFVWNGKKRYIKKATLLGSYEQGGLAMIDIPCFFSALKIKWISRFLEDKESLWSKIFKYFFKKFGGELVLYCNMSKRSCQKMGQCPVFNRDILSEYFDFRLLDQRHCDNCDKFIWNNERVTVDGKVIFVEELFNAGLWYISDLYDSEGKLIAFDVWNSRGVEKKFYMKWCSVVSAVTKALKTKCLRYRNFKKPLRLLC